MEWNIENECIAEGFKVIAGTDEAGRGPLAGPVCAAAVILPAGIEIPGLNDSKKLSEKKRNILFDIITEKAIAYAVAYSSVEEIDSINILNASQLAMQRAVSSLNIAPDIILVDGNIARGFTQPTKCVIHGDALSPSIAAASILAKVSRDRLCIEMDKNYPEYGFAKHKGYGTKEHMQAIIEHGATPVHRKSFLSFLNKNKEK